MSRNLRLAICATEVDGKVCGHLKRDHSKRSGCLMPMCACGAYKPSRGHKYGAVPTGGYGSKLEAQRAAELRLAEKGGLITNLREHPTVDVTPLGGKHPCETILWKSDFVYEENGKLVFEDAKGIMHPDTAIKHKLLRYRYPTAELRISRRGRGKRIVW